MSRERCRKSTCHIYVSSDCVDCVEFWYTFGHPSSKHCSHGTYGVLQHVRTRTPHFYISGTVISIAFKFGVQIEGPWVGGFHTSARVWPCTCARADRTSISQKRLERLHSKLVFQITSDAYHLCYLAQGECHRSNAACRHSITQGLGWINDTGWVTRHLPPVCVCGVEGILISLMYQMFGHHTAWTIPIMKLMKVSF